MPLLAYKLKDNSLSYSHVCLSSYSILKISIPSAKDEVYFDICLLFLVTMPKKEALNVNIQLPPYQVHTHHHFWTYQQDLSLPHCQQKMHMEFGSM